MSLSVLDAMVEKLREASAAYHNGAAILSDADYDALEERVRKLSPNHPVLAEVGAPPDSGWPKVTHPLTMGSLEKVQNTIELGSWYTGKGTPKLYTSEKMDGISVLLTYEGGELVRAATRGDGTTGEDITRNVRIMQGVPSRITVSQRTLIRGEIVCKKSDFESHFRGESNPRNTASGTAKRQTGWQKCLHLTVYAYNATVEGVEYKTRQLEFEALRQWGFNTPQGFTSTLGEVEFMYNQYISHWREKADYEMDGLVVELDETSARKALGTTPDGLRPKGAVALKFPHDQKKTTLRDVIWQVGPTGRITPVALFDEVLLAGAKVKQASIHNVSRLKALDLYEGDEILVSRRNDVIPFVELNYTRSLARTVGFTKKTPPTLCPACNSSLFMRGEYLLCGNTESCPAQILGEILRWISKTGVLHFGEALVSAAVEAGLITSLGDLYRISPEALGDLDLDGRKVGGAAKRALDSLHANKKLSVDVFVGSLGIDLCGRRMVSMLVEGGFDTLDKLDTLTEAEIIRSVPGFGDTKAEAFVKGFAKKKGVMLDLLSAGVEILEPVTVTPTGTSMKGVSVCFTGVRDAALEAKIISEGGEIKSGVSKGLTILVCKDVNSASTKAQKARSLGTEVISLEDMRARVN